MQVARDILQNSDDAHYAKLDQVRITKVGADVVVSAPAPFVEACTCGALRTAPFTENVLERLQQSAALASPNVVFFGHATATDEYPPGEGEAEMRIWQRCLPRSRTSATCGAGWPVWARGRGGERIAGRRPLSFRLGGRAATALHARDEYL
jgi:hypothetical protein